MRTGTNRRESTPPARKQKDAVFNLNAPTATTVQLAGSFNDWSPSSLQMNRSEDGVWRAEVGLPPGRYEYKFVVDGSWCCDVTDAGPTDTADGCVPNDLGTMNRVIEIPQ